MIEIRNGFGYLNGVQLPYKASPNVSGTLSKPTAAILHDTASGLNESSPISWLTNPQAKASAHVVIARDGKITQLVPFNKQAWHAGVSKWNGRSGCNAFTLGIEIVNPGTLKRVSAGVYQGVQTYRTPNPAYEIADMPADKYHGAAAWMTYTDEQIESVIALCRGMIAAYPSITEILTHYLISPGRKVDVNPLFPLQSVRDSVLGQKQAAPAAAAVKANVEAKPIADATVMADGLNLRVWPSTDTPPQCSLPKGTRLDIQPSSALDWWKVTVADGVYVGKTGYVAKSFVKLD